MAVTETFFAVEVRDMDRATAFYVRALGATVMFASPGWTSLQLAGVRVGLAFRADFSGAPTGLHFAVDDLSAMRAQIASAGGQASAAPVQAAPGVLIASVVDTEGNTFTLRED
jgi:predicted enzyme related to lactoylglutathione lyase